MFTIERSIEIDAGHRVPTHDSKCRNLHGHRYKVVVVAESSGLIEEGSQTAMTVDFGCLKGVLTRRVHDIFDHGLMLYYKDPLVNLLLPEEKVSMIVDEIERGAGVYPTAASCAANFVSVVALPFIPTAEELARYWYSVMTEPVHKFSSGNAKLVEVRVFETPNSVGIYHDE